MTEGTKKKLLTTQRQMIRMTEKEKNRSPARRERRRYRRRRSPHDPVSEREDDTTAPNLSVHEEYSHDADSNSSFDEVSNDNPEDELAR